MLQRLADRVILAWGWERRLIALAGGAAGAAALAPFHVWPAMAITCSIAVWLIDGASGETRRRQIWQAALDGWWWGFGYHLAGLWWLGTAFLVEADKFAWAMPLGVIALPAALALFTAAAFALCRLAWSSGGERLLVFAGVLAASEWLRGHLFTGFPWNAYGMALGGPLWLAQAASVIGLYGLTALALLIFAGPATLATGLTPLARWRAPVASLALLAGLAGYGLWRVPSTAMAMVPGVKLRIMQPNLPQDAKFRPDQGEAILARYLSLSDRATGPRTLGLQDVTHLIWPESAFPFLLDRSPAALRRIEATLPQTTVLLTGAARAGEQLPGEGRPPIYNSIQVVSKGAGIVASADKVHLVPFGEYLPSPFERLIRAVGLKEFVAIPGGFSAAATPRALAAPGLPLIAPLICYEVVFPGEVVPRGPWPGVMLNLTNDGWFGDSTGPYQHLFQARLRSIEEGLPLIRAANTGISAVIDPFGRFIGRLEIGREDVLDAGLPRALAPTVYSKAGDSVFLAWIVLSVAAAGWIQRRRRTHSSA